MENTTAPRLSKKTLASIVIISFLVIVIPFGIYLAQNTQIFSPRASSQNIQIKDANGNALPEEGGVPVTNSTAIKVTLEAPDAP